MPSPVKEVDKKEKIRKFFNNVSRNRDSVFESCPILMYEQNMRQLAIIELLELGPGDTVLEVGCGNARDLIVFAQRGAECIGIDLSSGMIVEGKKKINASSLDGSVAFIVGDGTRLPLRNKVFNKLSCSEVIEHVPNYELCIKEMTRVLDEGGRLVITTPNNHSFYGLTRRLVDFFLKLLGISRKHPFDEWKTQEEVIGILSYNEIKTEKKIGICFIPGQLTYRLPLFCKRMIVNVCFILEKRVRWSLNRYGYNIGLSGRKMTEKARIE